jgi:mannose-6-phosphate isomerase
VKHYPLIFEPSLKKRIWGGSKINEIFGYPGVNQNIGEAWVVSDHPEGSNPGKTS